MPEYTQNSSIPYPGPGDPIRGNTTDNIRTDLRDLALAADRADVQTRVDAVQDAQIAAQPRYAFLESLASEPGSRVVNLVADPVPVYPSETHNSGRVTLVSAPGWGRAIADGTGATSVIPRLQQKHNTTGVDTPISPGQDVGFTLQIRAMPDQAMSATVNMISLSNGSSQGVFLTTEQLDLDPGQVLTFSATGTAPVGADSVRLIITFRRYGQAYPSAGDFIYWRRTGVYVGNIPSPLTYTTGDGDYSYWLGEPNKSASVTMRPKETGGTAVGGFGALSRQALLDEFTHRRGGIKKVPGKTVISFRVDHGLKNFAEKMLPKLEEHDFPYALALNSRDWGHPENEGITPSIVNQWVEDGLAEVWNHGPSHADASDNETIYDYIINTRTERFPC